MVDGSSGFDFLMGGMVGYHSNRTKISEASEPERYSSYSNPPITAISEIKQRKRRSLK
jgi:hypothetical protein